MCKSWEVESPKNKADGTVKLRPILLVFETKSLDTGTMNEQLRGCCGWWSKRQGTIQVDNTAVIGVWVVRVATNTTFCTQVVGRQFEQLGSAHPGMFRTSDPRVHRDRVKIAEAQNQMSKSSMASSSFGWTGSFAPVAGRSQAYRCVLSRASYQSVAGAARSD
jgi:hypothetical protein